MFQVLFRRRQRALLDVQRKQVIASDSGEDDESSDYGTNVVLRKRQIDIEKYTIALAKYLKEKNLDEIDKRLLKGFYVSQNRMIERSEDRKTDQKEM